MDNKIEQINEVRAMNEELKRCKKKLEHRVFRGEFNSLSELLEFFDYSIEDTERLFELKEPLNKYNLDLILLLLNLADYLNDPKVPDFMKKTVVSINNSKLESYNLITNILHSEEKYYHNQCTIYYLNNYIIDLLQQRFDYKNKVISFNKKILKRINQKLNVPLPFNHEYIFNKIDSVKVLEEFKNTYEEYINERTNEIIKILNDRFNMPDSIDVNYFNDENTALEKISELIIKINDNLINQRLKKLQESIIDMIEGKNEKYKDYKKFNLISVLEIDYKNEISNCNSDKELKNQVNIYSDLINKTTIILAWAYYLDIDITNSIDNIKILIKGNDIKYIISNYKQIIQHYIVNYIEQILNNKFKLSNTRDIVMQLVQNNIENYDNVDEEKFSYEIEIVTKESIKSVIKENIKTIPKKLFKSQFAILSTVNDSFNAFYDQLNNNEISINELIQLIITEDEHFNNLNKSITEEIELIFMLWNTEKEIVLNDFNLFLNNCLSKYKDIESRSWILNYLKTKINNNIELQAIINNFNNNNNDENKDQLKPECNDSQPDINELPNISYLFLKDGLKNNINKNNFHSNEEKEKYLYLIRECINYLISNNYKENNNSKFTLKKYQKSNVCWKLKKTNNEMLLRMVVNFQKDNIIIGSVFRRPETDKKYNLCIDRAECDINDIMNALENDNIIERLHLIYDSILNLKEFYEYLHANISYLNLEDKNEDNGLIIQIIFKFINELNNINYDILPFNIVESINKIKNNIINILENYGYKLNGKVLTKK